MRQPARIGYARCADSKRDQREQIDALTALRCDRFYLDRGLTGADRSREELDAALADCQPGDTLVVADLARLVTSLPDAVATFHALHERGVTLEVNGHLYHWPEPANRDAFMEGLSLAAGLVTTLLRLHTRAGLEIARHKGKARGGRYKLTESQRENVRMIYARGLHSMAELGEDFGVSAATISRIVNAPRLPDAESPTPRPT